MNKKALIVLPVIIFSLLTAVWSGWIRIGVSLPVSIVAAQHGSIMVNCFLASLIFLERAVTFKNKAILLLPFFNAFAVVGFFTGFTLISEWIHIVCSLGFMVMCAYFIYKYKELYYYVFFAGAFCLLTGNIMLAKTGLFPMAVVWWMLYLIFTIVAERLELSRFLPVNKLKQTLLIIALSAVFLAAFIPYHSNGNIFLSVTIALTALWLLKYDMAFKTIKVKGQHRYSALLLIIGYVWLLITAALFAVYQNLSFGYDALLHSFFIGFVFAMIFSHAPVILPAVTRLSIKIYHPVLYVWFGLLQLSLMIRVIADLFNDFECRKYAGLANGIAILLFFISIAFIVISKLKQRKRKLSKA